MPDVTTSLRIPNYGSAPSGLSGQLYFNSTDKQFYYHDGTNWVMLGLASSSGNVSASGSPASPQLAQWTDATHIQGITNTLGQWTGTATGLTASTGRTSLGASNIGADIFTRAAPGGTAWIKANALGTIAYEDAATTKTSLSLNNVTNDAQIKSADFPSSSVDSEIALFSSTTGKVLKRSTSTGILTGASGVIGTTPDNHANWDTAFTDRNKWDGGATGLTASTGRRSLVIGDSEEYEVASTAQQSISAVDVYILNSAVTLPAGTWAAGGQYRCKFVIQKTAGVGGITITARLGTAASTSDASVYTTGAFPAGTGVADTGTFEVILNFRTIGATGSTVGSTTLVKNLTATGLSNTGTLSLVLAPVVTSSVSTTTATKLGLSFNGSTSFAGTIDIVQAEYKQ